MNIRNDRANRYNVDKNIGEGEKTACKIQEKATNRKLNEQVDRDLVYDCYHRYTSRLRVNSLNDHGEPLSIDMLDFRSNEFSIVAKGRATR